MYCCLCSIFLFGVYAGVMYNTGYMVTGRLCQTNSNIRLQSVARSMVPVPCHVLLPWSDRMPSRRTDQWRCSLILLALSRFSQNIHVASCLVPIFATPRSHQAKPDASPVEADMDLMLEMKSHYQTEIGWNRLDTCVISYIYIHVCVCTYIYLYIRPAKILLVCVSVFQASRVSRLCCLRHASWICDVNYMSVYLYSIQIKFSARPKMTTRHPLLNKCWLSRSHDPESEESHHPISPHVTTMSLQKVL